ncbi:LysE family translocator [Pseudogulbenkiania subflava]|uniref:Threonine/homoserine/homoserine lactone efflux protein n=1 Tax=Pseudogulbenkiania subflava DSM 22618 TaxID=1123014 RepID=A0A1Y6BSE8_9NEIS|nr:LysE family translocator [Pseudogulbenkiania subflava]SMF24718.1 Threonine/homoserine/homoserine lactone efflux protein [Pseudogulbenkiania subflava DSM 22618]
MLELPLLTYFAVMSITPGPNNLMLAASGVNFGFRRTVPHLLGISIGNGFQLFVIASLLAMVLGWVESARLPLALAGCLYLLWLSWKIARAGHPEARAKARPLGFFGAALFQWLNPKAWVMVVNTAILFMPAGATDRVIAALVLAVTCMAINFPCVSVWAWTGDRLRQWLAEDRARRQFNTVMAVLMAGTALWLLGDEIRHAGLL